MPEHDPRHFPLAMERIVVVEPFENPPGVVDGDAGDADDAFANGVCRITCLPTIRAR